MSRGPSGHWLGDRNIWGYTCGCVRLKQLSLVSEIQWSVCVFIEAHRQRYIAVVVHMQGGRVNTISW
jgi:hypothetical protein